MSKNLWCESCFTWKKAVCKTANEEMVVDTGFPKEAMNIIIPTIAC